MLLHADLSRDLGTSPLIVCYVIEIGCVFCFKPCLEKLMSAAVRHNPLPSIFNPNRLEWRGRSDIRICMVQRCRKSGVIYNEDLARKYQRAQPQFITLLRSSTRSWALVKKYSIVRSSNNDA